MSDYRPGVPEPVMADALWLREVCDRLDKVLEGQAEMVALLKGQNKILSGTQSVSISGPVELTEPKVAKAAPAARATAPAARATTAAAKK
jgi:hypothetical protein